QKIKDFQRGHVNVAKSLLRGTSRSLLDLIADIRFSTPPPAYSPTGSFRAIKKEGRS
ncbi:14732_t:CDS:2, partial [Gigaspora rosea]